MAKILLVDDDPILQRMYQTLFTTHGYTVVSTGDGDEAVRLAQTEKPDLILLDIILTTLFDGLNVLQKLKNSPLTNRIRVIVLTNLDDKMFEALQKGAVWYFIKSNTKPEQVLTKVGEILETKKS